MRNLKRVLSLALASTMLLGMMVVGAGAADAKKTVISDMDKVVNKEAVTLMVDLGIIAGKPDGTYSPAEEVDRATMARLITAVMMGDVDPGLFEGTVTDLKDIEDSWAKGYIKYCYANKIIAGDGIGSFFPTLKVTAAEAAKMLLIAIGYDATAQGYGGSSWTINVMRDAKTAGLLTGVTAKTNDPMTRDNAAQMLFNALNTKTITYTTQYDQGIAYKVDPSTSKDKVPNPTLGELQYDLVKVTAMVEKINNKGMLDLGTITPAGNADTFVDEKLPGTPAMVGSVVSIYVKGAMDAAGKLVVTDVYSTTPTVSASNVLATNNGLKGSGLTSKSGTAALTALLVTDSTKVASYEADVNNSNVTVYYNGEKKTLSEGDTAIAKVGKFGVVTEFKDTNAKAGVDTIVITEKKVATLSAAPVVSGNTVTISSLALAKVDTAKVVGYEDLVKGDVVLYVQMGGMTYIEKAEMVEGIATGSHNTKGMMLDGSYYLSSDLAGKANDWAGTDDYTNTYKFYLDNGKNIVKSVKVTDETATGSYAVLANIALVKTDGVNGTHYVEAKIVKTDGTVEVVKVASIDGVSVVLKDASLAASATAKLYAFDTATVTEYTANVTAVEKTFYYTNPTGTEVKAKYFAAETSGNLTSGNNQICTNTITGAATGAAYAVPGQVYEYTVNSDGNYVLSTKLGGKATYGKLDNSAIFNNKAVFNTGNIGNSATIFLYESADGNGKPVYTVYTGIANVPGTNGSVKNPGTNTIIKNASGVATFVYAKISGTTSASNDYVYIYDIANYTTAKNGSATYYIFDAIVNGVNETVKLAGIPAAVGLYPVSSVNDKDIKTLDTVNTDDKYTGVISVSGGSLITDTTSAKAFTYEDAEIYYVDSKNNSTTVTGDSLALNAYDTVYVLQTTSGSGVAKIIYVISEDPALKVLTITGGTSAGGDDLDLADGKGIITVDNNSKTITLNAATAKDKATYGTITFNDQVVAVGGTFTVDKGVSTITVKVMVTDNASGAEDVITATITVNGSDSIT